MAETCIYKSVTMLAGETYVLPPGAQVVSVSDLGAVTSSCPDPLPTEELLCYRIAWVINIDPNGIRIVDSPMVHQRGVPSSGPGLATVDVPETGNAWENNGESDTGAITIDKIGIAGTPTTAGGSYSDFAALEATIVSSPLGGILSDRKYNHSDTIQPLTTDEFIMWNNWWRSGYTVYTLHFKSIPSIASTVYLEFLSALNAEGGNIGSIPRYFAKEIDCSTYPITTEI